MEQVRSFIAIELPEELKRELTGLQKKLQSGGPSPVKWVSPDSIHLTLKFLGNVPADLLPRIKAALAEAVKGLAPFRLEVKRLGVFPNARRVRVVWVGLEGDIERLKLLQQRVEETISPLGFPTEAREFTAHLTLARVREEATPQERQELGEIIAAASFEAKTAIAVDELNLMKSQLTPKGAIYTRLEAAKLG